MDAPITPVNDKDSTEPLVDALNQNAMKEKRKRSSSTVTCMILKAVQRLSSLNRIFHNIEILTQDLVHGKHVNLVLLENAAHTIIASYLTFVIWILKTICLDIFPYLLDSLRTRKCSFSKQVDQRL